MKLSLTNKTIHKQDMLQLLQDMAKRKTGKQISEVKRAQAAGDLIFGSRIFSEAEAEAERAYDEAPLPYGFHKSGRNCPNHPQPSFFEPTEDDDFKFYFGKIKFYSDLNLKACKKKKKQKNKTHKVYQFEELKPEVGDFVKFKNFEGDNQRFNGKIGLIQKEMDHFGDGDSLEPRFKIATMNEENNFRQITTANFEIIKNCNSVHNRMEVGEMMWPKVKGMHAPCSHWVNDDRLTAMTMDFFNALHFYEQEPEFAETMPKTNKYKEECVGEWNGRTFKLNENTNVAFLFFKKPCLYNGMIPGVWFPFVEDYCARVKDVFGWTKPKLFRHISHTERSKN